MISLYFDRNLLSFVAVPGNPAPTSLKLVYGDNYNIQIGIVAAGVFQSINSSDTLSLLLYQPGTLPDTQLAIIGTPTKTSDANGNDCFQCNINLFTTALATLVQTPNTPITNALLRVVFSPVDGERFSTATDLPVTVVPDVTQGASGATPASGTYPALNGNAATFLDGAGAWVTPTGSTFLTTVVSFTIPAALSTVVLTVASHTDIVVGASVYVTDGTLFMNGVVTVISGTSVTVKNLGAPGSVSGTMGTAHLYIGNVADITTTSQFGTVKPDGSTVTVSGGVISVPTATSSVLGLVKPDGTKITVSSGAITVPTATSSVLGVVKPDGTTIANSSGAISVPTATTSALGLVKPDGTTITISSGVISSSGGGGGSGGASTTTTANFTCPGYNLSVTGVTVASSAWMQIGKEYFVIGVGSFICTANNTGTNTISLQNTGAYGNNSSGTVSTGALIIAAPFDASVHYVQDEFFWNIQSPTNATAVGPWFFLSSAGFIANGSTFTTDSSGIAFNTSTSATASLAICYGGNAGFLIGTNIVMNRWRVYIPTLSTSSQRFALFFGIGGPQASAFSSVTRSVGFSYTDNVNSGDWTCTYLKSGTTTTVDSTVAVAAATSYDLYLIIDPTNAYWLIGSNNATPVQVKALAWSGLFTTGLNYGSTASMVKSVGTTASTADVLLFEQAIAYASGPNPRYTLRGLAVSGS